MRCSRRLESRVASTPKMCLCLSSRCGPGTVLNMKVLGLPRSPALVMMRLWSPLCSMRTRRRPSLSTTHSLSSNPRQLCPPLMWPSTWYLWGVAFSSLAAATPPHLMMTSPIIISQKSHKYAAKRITKSLQNHRSFCWQMMSSRAAPTPTDRLPVRPSRTPHQLELQTDPPNIPNHIIIPAKLNNPRGEAGELSDSGRGKVWHYYLLSRP